jgi:hypothetical protein
MSKKVLPGLTIFLALFSVLFAQQAKAQTITSRNFGERFVIRSLGTIHGAQMTYQATAGNGTYGSLQDLREAGFIDAVLAGGEKHGYIFALSVTHPTATVPAKFSLTATPRLYRKSGRFSYFVDERGDVRGADKNGGVATVNDPIVDTCSFYGDAAGNERCAILALRTLYSAELTYASTVGNGSFGNHVNLYAAGLIGQVLADGSFHGYDSVIIVYAAPQPSFKILAIPQNYGVTGRRSFYIDAEGVLRSADKQGASADQNDPPIND